MGDKKNKDYIVKHYKSYRKLALAGIKLGPFEGLTEQTFFAGAAAGATAAMEMLADGKTPEEILEHLNVDK